MTEIWRVVGFIKKVSKEDNFESLNLTAYGPTFKSKEEAQKYLEKIKVPADYEILLKPEKFYRIKKNKAKQNKDENSI